LTFLITLIVTGLVLALAQIHAGPALAILGALLILIPASELAVSLVNWDLTHMFSPKLLPKIDLAKGIPADACTIVVVPALICDEASVDELLDKLEIAYLANQDKQLYFGLITDFEDARREQMPTDQQVLDAVRQGIERLNQRYQDGEGNRFHLFHRRRQWCETEDKWIGWERKRGKLTEFNRLLRGARDTSFIISTAEPALLAEVRYVITLDADTQLPRDAARRLIGTALHPLNHPRFDAESGWVRAGYSILQPRVS